MITLATVWLLLTQGTGPSSSAINTVHTYTAAAECEAAAAKIKATFWASTLCLPVKESP
ncbi:hypothetical protein [Bradyrhizobium sp. 153]|uniref:hypothetical protein n=1 Tax=Bradyrhizobium sp. 153 TaxID=2782627 RepID=UPI001FF74A27|nr:hypothetical protein [Bradyrhizobium sp. 153]MCK1668638.1 hypothetical protein [Bradyrhizobium sp. 153]